MLNKAEIMEIIPHRDPFLLIDEVIELEPGVNVTAKKYITKDEYYFKGHFPGNPVVPGVILIETIAQAGAVCILTLPKYKGKTAYFAGINKVKFKKKVLPETELTLKLEVIKTLGNIGIGSGKAYDGDGDMVACCELTFAVE